MSEFSFSEGAFEGHEHGSDSHGHHESVHHHEAAQEGNASSTAAYNAGIKLSDIFSGFKITPNGITALFFIGYAAWLFVIYFIRHNEPLANHVLGTPTAGSPTSHDDRIIVGATKNALPIQAVGNNGFYTPDKKHYAASKLNSLQEPFPNLGDPSNFSAQSEMARSGSTTEPMTQGSFGSAAFGYKPIATQGNNHSRVIHVGRERIVVHHPEPLPGELEQSPNNMSPRQTYAPQQSYSQPRAYAPPYPNSAQPLDMTAPQANFNQYPAQQAYPMTTSNGNYHMPVHTQEGMKLRTVVNR